MAKKKHGYTTGTIRLDSEQTQTLIAELAQNIGNYEKLAELVNEKDEGRFFRRLGRNNAITKIREYIEEGKIPDSIARNIYDLLGENKGFEFLRFHSEHNINANGLNHGFNSVLEGYISVLREKYSSATNPERIEMLGQLESIINEE